MSSRRHGTRRKPAKGRAASTGHRRTRKDSRRTVAAIPIEEIGPRIVANAKNELADIIREQYWKAKGEKVWRAVCKASLRARCANTWVEVVRRLGRA